MDTAAEIKKALVEALGVTPNLPITATVVSIEVDTCTVKLLSELVLSDVRLTATSDEAEDYFRVIPKEDSEVILMSQTGTLSGLFVVKVNEVKSINYKQGELEFSLDSSDKKMLLKNDSTSLYEIMSELVALLKGLKVFTPAGVSGIPIPDTIAKITQVETKFKSILKEN